MMELYGMMSFLYKSFNIKADPLHKNNIMFSSIKIMSKNMPSRED